MRRTLTIAVLAVMLATPGMANLLTNGSFDNLTGFVASAIPTFDGGDPLFVGSTTMTGWTVVDNNGLTANTNESIAWLLNGAYGLFTPDNGGAFLDLTGYYESVQNPTNLPGLWAGVRQTVNLPAGNYALSFFLGDSQTNPLYEGVVSVEVSDSIVDPIITNTAQGGDWQQETYSFAVPGGPTTIDIIGYSTTGGFYIGLDDVDLEATPEPGTALLAFPAVAGLLWYGRRKNLLRRQAQ